MVSGGAYQLGMGSFCSEGERWSNNWRLESKWIGYSIVVGCLLAYLTKAKVVEKSKETVNYR